MNGTKNKSLQGFVFALVAVMQVVKGQMGIHLPTTKLDGVAWFVQISDLHLSKYDHLPERQKLYGDKLGDLRTFARTVLSGLQPGALLITGDLIDAKSRLGRGQQWEEEWQKYRRAQDILSHEAGLPESSILDIRGNHDVFDMGQRGGERDWFPQYAAEGRREGLARVYNHALPSGPYGPEFKSKEKCPPVALVGVDATPGIGLRGPTNFAGWLTAEQTGQVDAELASLRTHGCSPLVVAYGHYPLPVIQEPETKPWASPAMSSTAPQQADLLSVLTRHNVSAYVSGHLHGAFGQRVHRMHRTPTKGRMAELENAAWKDDRRFRIMSVDQGVFSFVDLFMHTPSKPRSSAGPPSKHLHEDEGKNISITGVAPEVSVRKHLVHITSPPDARYSPLQAAERRQVYREVRALVAPVIPDRSGTKFPVLPQVLLTWRCAESGMTGQNTMAQVQAGQNLWRAPWIALASTCSPKDTLVYIQVHALERVKGKAPPPPASSELRPVSLIRSDGDKMLFTTPRRPLPLKLKLLEHIVLHWDWQLAAQRVFHLLWALQLGGLLLVPKLLHEWGLADRLRSAMKLQPAWLQRLTGLLMSPLLDLCSMAGMPAVWLPQVLYSLYLVVGPWMAAEYLSGEPPGLLFAGRVYFCWAGQWRARADADTLRLGLVHLGTFLIPATLWIASVVHRWSTLGQGSKQWLFSGWQMAGGLPVAAFHCLVAYRISYVSFGWPAVFFSPGVAWCLPLIGLLLYVHHRCMCRQPVPVDKKVQ